MALVPHSMFKCYLLLIPLWFSQSTSDSTGLPWNVSALCPMHLPATPPSRSSPNVNHQHESLISTSCHHCWSNLILEWLHYATHLPLTPSGSSVFLLQGQSLCLVFKKTLRIMLCHWIQSAFFHNYFSSVTHTRILRHAQAHSDTHIGPWCARLTPILEFLLVFPILPVKTAPWSVPWLPQTTWHLTPEFLEHL